MNRPALLSLIPGVVGYLSRLTWFANSSLISLSSMQKSADRMPRFEGLEAFDSDAFFTKFRDDAYGSLWDEGNEDGEGPSNPNEKSDATPNTA